jgi:uncharacterized membrane protein YozB (DUF420 family)
MKSDRMFYSTAAVLILLITVVGFFPFYTSGHGEGGRVIAPGIYPVVLVHGMGVTAWYVLSLVQSLLITTKNRRFHMKLGWSAVGLLPVVTVSGVLVAIRSAQGSSGFVFFGMNYREDFLLVMLSEIAVFTVLVGAGLLARKRPEIHRSMMLSASLSLLLGATTRIPALVALFGGHDSRVAFFGPVFVLTALLLLVRSVMIRSFDRWLAAGGGFMVLSYLVAERLARTDAWHQLAEVLLKS